MLSESGTYTVSVSRDGEGGDYQLQALLSAAAAEEVLALTREAGQPLLAFNGPLAPGAAQAVSFAAAAGEQLAVIAAGGEAAPFLVLEGADGSLLQGPADTATAWFGALTVTQTYVATLYGRSAAGFQLQVIGDALRREAAPQLVGFPSGRFGTTLAGVLDDLEDQDTYLLLAGADQEMVVTLRAASGSASFTLLAPDGTTLLPADYDGLAHWHGILPAGGQYTVRVATDRVNSAYTLDLTIAPPVTAAPLVAQSGSVEGTFAGGANVAAYTLELRAGQTVVLESSGTPPPALWIEGPDGYIEVAAALDRARFSSAEGGLFTVRLAARSGTTAADYRLLVTVE